MFGTRLLSKFWSKVIRFKVITASFRFAIYAWTTITLLVLLINALLLILALSYSNFQDGVGTLFHGSCSITKDLAFWTHIVINGLSTLLVSASNYCMQCLASPSRHDVDKAHEKGIWLHIGVPNYRNFRVLSHSNVIMWWLLAFSSLPLHLLYNSAIFSDLSTRQYNAFLLPESFFDGPLVDPTFFMAISRLSLSTDGTYFQNRLLQFKQDSNKVENLTVPACVSAYTSPTISQYSDVVLITSGENPNGPALKWEVLVSKLVAGPATYYSMNDWACNNTDCSVIGGQHTGLDNFNSTLDDYTSQMLPSWTTPDGNSLDSNISSIRQTGHWKVNGQDVRHCLAKTELEKCKLQFSFPILVVVIIGNMTKAICMIIIARRKGPEPLVTLGDAIDSFLACPDVTTKASCITGNTRLKNRDTWGSMSCGSWKTARWIRAASPSRWIISMHS